MQMRLPRWATARAGRTARPAARRGRAADDVDQVRRDDTLVVRRSQG